MATSSIFASFDIKDKKAAERFVEALEESANGPEWRPIAPAKPPLTDKSAILELWKKSNLVICQEENEKVFQRKG